LFWVGLIAGQGWLEIMPPGYVLVDQSQNKILPAMQDQGNSIPNSKVVQMVLKSARSKLAESVAT
jgi:hypothetical protein